MDEWMDGRMDKETDRQSYYGFCSGISLRVAAESVITFALMFVCVYLWLR